MSQTVARLQAVSRWLQAGADVRSRREAETRDKECLDLATTLEQELDALQNTMQGISVCAAVGRSPRLPELVAIYSASVHLLEQPAKIDRRPGKAVLCLAVAKWVNHVLSKVPARAPPTNLQLAVADALLRARLLQGLSRQLAGLADTVTAATQGSGGQIVQAAAELSAATMHVLFGAVASAAGTMRALTGLRFVGTPLRHSQGCTQGQVPCGGVPEVGAGSVADGGAERPENACAQAQGPKAEGRRAQEEERGAVLGGNSKQQQEQQQQQQRQGQGRRQRQGGCPQPAARLTAATLFPEVLMALSDSSVLEHLSRGVLLLAGWLQHPKQQRQQQQQQHDFLRVLQRACVHMTTLHRSLSSSTNSPDFLDGANAVHAASDGQAAAPEGRPPCLPPLEAGRHVLKAAHVSLLRRVLLGPCARHLVLCMGLCALAELDGGSTYGVPDSAGLRHVSVAAADKEPSGMSEVRQAAAVINLLTLLAMRTDDPGSGAGAGPGAGAGAGAGGMETPGRGMCLQLTLRAVHATVADGANRGRVGGCGGHGQPPGYFFFTVAVQALQFAWRHMPPPQGLVQGRGWRRDGCRRRRAALRQWAAAAEAVVCSRAATVVYSNDHDDSAHEEVQYRLGLLLGLHPSVVGPVERGDLPVLASGGHLLRGVEAVVWRFLQAVDGEMGVAERGSAGPAQANQPAPGRSGSPPHAGAAATAHSYELLALARLHPWGAGVRSRPLRDLLLQPGEDEGLPGAGQGQGHEEGHVEGQGGVQGQEEGQGQEQGQEEGPKEEAPKGKEEGAREAVEVGPGQEGGGGAERPGQGRGGGSLRAAASLVAALGKLLWRCEGRLVEAMGRCCDIEVGALGEQLEDTALEVMCALCDVLLTRLDDVAFEHLGEQMAGGEDGGAAAGEGGGGGRAGREAEAAMRRRVWVCAYGAWRWVPALASVARRTAAAGHVNGVSLLVWRAVLAWVGRLCLDCCDKPGVAEVGSAAGCGAKQLDAAPACMSMSISCGGAAALTGGGCWRAFLLRDVGVVGLLGAALCRMVPELLADEEDEEESRGVLAAAAEACVLAAAVFPEEVAQGAWGAPAGGGCTAGGGNSSSSSSSNARGAEIWHPKVLAALAVTVGGEREGRSLGRALRALEEWGVECGRVGGPVGFGAEQRRRLAQAVTMVESCYGSEADVGDGWEQDAALLPPLCGLRGLLRSCSNPRCAVLPPPGQTEAEAGARVDACRGANAGMWYCCAACREQHSLVGLQGEACGV